MTLTPSQLHLISTYRNDWLDGEDFKGDDNDLACVVSGICNKIATAGFAEAALKDFLENTPTSCMFSGDQTEVLRAGFEALAKPILDSVSGLISVIK